MVCRALEHTPPLSAGSPGADWTLGWARALSTGHGGGFWVWRAPAGPAGPSGGCAKPVGVKMAAGSTVPWGRHVRGGGPRGRPPLLGELREVTISCGPLVAPHPAHTAGEGEQSPRAPTQFLFFVTGRSRRPAGGDEPAVQAAAEARTSGLDLGAVARSRESPTAQKRGGVGAGGSR